MPNLGSVHILDEHWAQNIWPQLRQWCFRTVNENSTRQRWQTSPSDHDGAVSDVNMASASFNSGNWCPFVFKIVTVSCICEKKSCVSCGIYLLLSLPWTTLIAWYLSYVRKANAHAWINSNIFNLTFSCGVVSMKFVSISQFSFVQSSSWIGEPQFLTTLSRTYKRRKIIYLLSTVDI